jgi:cobalt-zinc-cadmium efflux system outer membrane protein
MRFASSRFPSPPALVLAALALAHGGCASAPDDVLDAAATLRTLEGLTLAAPPPASLARVTTTSVAFDPSDGLDSTETSALALHLHPRLRALREEVGVARAELVEAGLLPDPTIGWESGNVVADFITDRKSSANSYIAGLTLAWDVPRPGEIGAREAAAAGRIQEARALLLQAEWELVRDVRLACVRLAAAEAGLALNAEQTRVAESTSARFVEAQRLGATTAIQTRLAAVAAARVFADQVRIELEATEARQALLALLGLPPRTPFVLQGGAALLEAAAPDAARDDLDALVALALKRRPDLAALAAQHAQAEAGLRLEEAGRWPQVSIGSGVGVELPFFSRFNAPAVETARRARLAARLRYEAAVHDVRRDVHTAHARLRLSAALVQRLQDTLVPAVADALRLTRLAVEAGEFTAFEVLTAQTQTLEAQTELLGARVRQAEARVGLESAAGRLTPTPEASPPGDLEETP